MFQGHYHLGRKCHEKHNETHARNSSILSLLYVVSTLLLFASRTKNQLLNNKAMR